MREPIREPTPEERGSTGPQPMRYTSINPVREVIGGAAPASLVEWAPIWGGMFVSLGVLFLLSSLGVAFGFGSGTEAGIWGAVSLIVGFFVGGWFTGRTMSIIDSTAAWAHGLLTWAVTIVLTLVFAVVAALTGIGALASIRGFLAPLGISAGAPAPTAPPTVTSTWWPFVILLLGVASAIIGALVGNKARFSDVRH